jgi:predicted DNA-binding protein (MmcQ/YjbR family)
MKGVTEDIKWGHDLCFSIGGKMFCVTSLEPPFTCSFKVTDEEFEELSARDGFIPAPYMARAKWVQVTDPSKLHKKEWKDFLRQSYELKKASLTKKVRREMGLDD